MRRDWHREYSRPRRRRTVADLVKLAAFLGSPGSELSDVLDVPLDAIRATVREGASYIPAPAVDRLASWVVPLYWRRLWRSGDEWARSREAIISATNAVANINIPADFLRDWRLAVAGL